MPGEDCVEQMTVGAIVDQLNGYTLTIAAARQLQDARRQAFIDELLRLVDGNRDATWAEAFEARRRARS